MAIKKGLVVLLCITTAGCGSSVKQAHPARAEAVSGRPVEERCPCDHGENDEPSDWPHTTEDATGIEFVISQGEWGFGNALRIRYTLKNLSDDDLWFNYDMVENAREFFVSGEVALEITDGTGQPAKRIAECSAPHGAPWGPPLRVLLGPRESISVVRTTLCGVYAPGATIFIRATYHDRSRVVPPPEPATTWFRGTLVSNKLEVIVPL